MTWCVPPYDQAIAQLLTYVRTTYAPRGVVVAGSIVRGEAGPTSDFDVIVIHDEPWRLREQRRFHGVPAELFVNPPAQIRRYFANEHDRGRPSTAHMLATGTAIAPVDPTIDQLVREARDWLARPLALRPAQLDAMRYAAVDTLDDASDLIDGDPPAARLLLAEAVRQIIEYRFWREHRFQPRRKAAITALTALDPDAATLVRRWTTDDGRNALATVQALARHVLGVDSFFAWSSERDPVAI
jgi:hypothetical protein